MCVLDLAAIKGLRSVRRAEKDQHARAHIAMRDVTAAALTPLPKRGADGEVPGPDQELGELPESPAAEQLKEPDHGAALETAKDEPMTAKVAEPDQEPRGELPESPAAEQLKEPDHGAALETAKDEPLPTLAGAALAPAPAAALAPAPAAALAPAPAAEPIQSPPLEEPTSIEAIEVDGWLAPTQPVGDEVSLDLDQIVDGLPPAEQPQLLLYSSVYLVNGKRPVLAVYDARNDPAELSSRKVKRCAWIRNAPPSLLDAEQTPNKAVCALRDALNPGAVQGSSGVNARMALCTNEAPGESSARLKTAIASGALASLIMEGAPP